MSRTTAPAGWSGKVSVAGRGDERQELLELFLGVERVAAQLVDRADRVRTGRLTEELVQKHQVSVWLVALRFLDPVPQRTGIVASDDPHVIAAALTLHGHPLIAALWSTGV